MQCTQTYSELRETSKIKLFKKVFQGIKPISIFAKSSLLDVWFCSLNASDIDSSMDLPVDNQNKVPGWFTMIQKDYQLSFLFTFLDPYLKSGVSYSFY